MPLFLTRVFKVPGALLPILLIVFNLASFANKGSTNLFLENKGQIVDQHGKTNNDVLYTLRSPGLNIHLNKNGYSYEFFRLDRTLPVPIADKKILANELQAPVPIVYDRVDVVFEGGSSSSLESKNKGNGYDNYFLNGISISGVCSYERIIYHDVYPSTDIEFIATGDPASPMKYNIILRPGSDIAKIKLKFLGAKELSVSPCTGLNIFTGIGHAREEIPLSFYQDTPGKNVPVEMRLEDNILSFFTVINNTKTFIIDPSSSRIWGTYYGDAVIDYGNAVGSDTLNNIYFAGYTLSNMNIATSGTYQTTINASFDAYLVKFTSAGTRVWGTYFGGESVDVFWGIKVLPDGTVYGCGNTFSTTSIASVGAHQTTYGGGIDDAILTKFDPNGQLQWATYYGGIEHDIANGVTVDSNGDVIIAGHTESPNAIVTVGTWQQNLVFLFDAFLAKFSPTGTRIWGTYYGDQGTEEGLCVGTDLSNNVFIGGFTTSPLNMTTIGSHQTVFGGGQDAYIAKFNSTGVSLLWATYYGDAGNDQVTSLKISSSGNMYVAGNTTSAAAIATTGSFQSSISSADDAFIAAFNNTGIRQWGTYVGGNDVDYLSELILDNNGDLLLSGSTMSTNNISTTGAWQTANSSPGNYDAFLCRFRINGTRDLSTYYGGSSGDFGRGVALDKNNTVYLFGETSSPDSISSIGSFMPVYGGNTDAFLARFCVSPRPTVIPSTSVICFGDSLPMSTQTGYTTYLWNTGATTSSWLVPDTLSEDTFYFYVMVTDIYGCTGTSDSASVIVNICNSIHEFTPAPGFIIYPNPFSEEFTIDASSVAIGFLLVSVYSQTGQLVYCEIHPAGKLLINLDDKGSGLYTLLIGSREKTYCYKLIKW